MIATAALFGEDRADSGVQRGLKGTVHCGAVRLDSPLCSCSTTSTAACSRSSWKPVASHSSLRAAVDPAFPAHRFSTPDDPCETRVSVGRDASVSPTKMA